MLVRNEFQNESLVDVCQSTLELFNVFIKSNYPCRQQEKTVVKVLCNNQVTKIHWKGRKSALLCKRNIRVSWIARLRALSCWYMQSTWQLDRQMIAFWFPYARLGWISELPAFQAKREALSGPCHQLFNFAFPLWEVPVFIRHIKLTGQTFPELLRRTSCPTKRMWNCLLGCMLHDILATPASWLRVLREPESRRHLRRHLIITDMH